MPPCNTKRCRIGSSAAVDIVNNLVFFGAENAYLYALNATTGTLAWKQQLGDPTNGAEVWSSPASYNGLVYVGLASHDDAPCVIGLINAYNELTGATVWSFNTIDQSTCPGGTCVGGAVWSSVQLTIPTELFMRVLEIRALTAHLPGTRLTILIAYWP